VTRPDVVGPVNAQLLRFGLVGPGKGANRVRGSDRIGRFPGLCASSDIGPMTAFLLAPRPGALSCLDEADCRRHPDSQPVELSDVWFAEVLVLPCPTRLRTSSWTVSPEQDGPGLHVASTSPSPNNRPKAIEH